MDVDEYMELDQYYEEKCARLELLNTRMLEALEMAFGLLQEYRGMYQHPDNIDPVMDEIEAVLMAAKVEA